MAETLQPVAKAFHEAEFYQQALMLRLTTHLIQDNNALLLPLAGHCLGQSIKDLLCLTADAHTGLGCFCMGCLSKCRKHYACVTGKFTSKHGLAGTPENACLACSPCSLHMAFNLERFGFSLSTPLHVDCWKGTGWTICRRDGFHTLQSCRTIKHVL